MCAYGRAESKVGKVSFGGMWSRLLPFSCLAEGLTLAMLRGSKVKDNSIENPGYSQVSVSLWHSLFLCTGEHTSSQALCSASQVLCVSSGALRIMRSWAGKGRVPGKQLHLVEVGKMLMAPSSEALGAFLDGIHVICQHLCPTGGHPQCLKESWTLCRL